jgi:hypothetical protein
MDYDVIITTHAVRLFKTLLQFATEPEDQTLVAEWHNANFEEIWAKKKMNGSRRKNRQNGFIVDDEGYDSALKAIKKRKNKPGMWILESSCKRNTDCSRSRSFVRDRGMSC